MPTNTIGPGPERDAIMRKLRGGVTPSSKYPKGSIERFGFDLGVKTSKGIDDRIINAIAPKKPKQPRGMNKWEAAYALVLKARKQTGEIADFEFEGLSFKLGRGARFKPDFLVVNAPSSEGSIRPLEIECHEVKGRWREAARVRIKVAASKYPWCRFIAVSKDGAGWKQERFEP